MELVWKTMFFETSHYVFGAGAGAGYSCGGRDKIGMNRNQLIFTINFLIHLLAMLEAVMTE